MIKLDLKKLVLYINKIIYFQTLQHWKMYILQFSFNDDKKNSIKKLRILLKNGSFIREIIIHQNYLVEKYKELQLLEH